MNVKRVAIIAVIAILVAVGTVAYSFLRTPTEATAPITAIPLAANSAAPSAADKTDVPAAAATPREAAANEAPAEAAEQIIAQIAQDESQARFLIDEVLNGEDVTVVGATNQVAGEIAVDPQNPDATQVGVIQINARTLATDNNFRDRAIKNQILNTDQYEFITFTPTEIVGLPDNGEVGQRYTFQIVGDLTIRDQTRQVTFDVTANPVSDTRLEGSANTTINYADFGITIPQVRQVAGVSDEVRLEIDFVAVPQS